MKALCLRAAARAVSALIVVAPASALAQEMPVGGVRGSTPQQPGSGSLFPGNGSLYPTPLSPPDSIAPPPQSPPPRPAWQRLIFFEEPEVVHDVVVMHDQPAEPPAPPPPPSPPREPYALGRSYGSLPGGCMKMIASGASYFQCSGEWYRQVGARRYIGVEMP